MVACSLMDEAMMTLGTLADVCLLHQRVLLLMLKLRLGICCLPVRVDKLTRLQNAEVYWTCRTCHIAPSHRRCYDISRAIQLIALSMVSGAWRALLARN